jgi:hypothetical protein
MTEDIFVLNCYLIDRPTNNNWKSIHDKFPVNTYRGCKSKIIDKASEWLSSCQGLGRLEIVVDPNHVNFSIGQSPVDI